MSTKIAERFAFLVACLVGAGALATMMNAQPSKPSHTGPAQTIAAIGQDLAKLKTKFPQMVQFSVDEHVHPDRLTIDYNFHTHRSQQRGGGWTAQVPNPDDDGVWFYINFHDPNSTAQIDTQPSQDPTAAQCFEDKRLTFLILEGKDTKSVGGAISGILKRHGVKRCASQKSSSNSGA